MTNRHQMVLQERTKKQINAYPQQPLCVNVPQIPNIEASIRFTAQTMNSHDIAPYYVGPINNICLYCNALHFPNEALNCCHNGKVSLTQLSSYPEELKNLLMSNSSKAKNFRQHIRQYNSAFAFASLGANIDKITTRGPYCFCIHGQIYHRNGCLHPADGNDSV